MLLWCCCHESELTWSSAWVSVYLSFSERARICITFSLTLKIQLFRHSTGGFKALPSGRDSQKSFRIYFSWPTTSCFHPLLLKSYCAVLSSEICRSQTVAGDRRAEEWRSSAQGSHYTWIRYCIDCCLYIATLRWSTCLQAVVARCNRSERLSWKRRQTKDDLTHSETKSSAGRNLGA